MKQDDRRGDHPKLLDAGPLAAHLDDCAIYWCNRERTDGFVPRAQVPRLVNLDGVFLGESKRSARPADARQLAAELVRVGRWEVADGGFQVHDYLDHQSSAEQIEREQEAARERQRAWRERQKRRPRNGGDNAVSNGVSNPVTNAAVTPPVTPGVTGPEERRRKKETAERSNDLSVVDREDVTLLCSLLGELVVANGRPKALVDPGSKTWRDAARRLLDIEKRPLEEALRLIRWCQQDEFWRANVLSMPKFRDQYDKLRLKAGAAARPAVAPVDRTDERLAEAQR